MSSPKVLYLCICKEDISQIFNQQDSLSQPPLIDSCVCFYILLLLVRVKVIFSLALCPPLWVLRKHDIRLPHRTQDRTEDNGQVYSTGKVFVFRFADNDIHGIYYYYVHKCACNWIPTPPLIPYTFNHINQRSRWQIQKPPSIIQIWYLINQRRPSNEFNRSSLFYRIFLIFCSEDIFPDQWSFFLLLIYTGTGPPHTPTIPMIWSLCSIIIIITFCLSCSGCFVVKKDLASNQFPTNIVLPLLQSKKAAYKMYVCVCVSTLSSNRSHPFTPQYN